MACWFLQKLNWIFLISLITLVLIDVKIGGSFVEEKSSFKILALFFSSKLNRDSKIISIVKPASKNIGTLIHSMKFLSPEVALYLYKSTIQPCKENCCHVWAGAPGCYLEWLDKLQKRIHRTAGPSLAPSLEPFAHCQSLVSLSLFYRYYCCRCSSELAQLVALPYPRRRSTCYLIDLMIFCHHSQMLQGHLCQQCFYWHS